jgi:CRISPR-associated endonuclease/helicase Cas3
MSIDADFRALTGFFPLSWQKRLYAEHLAGGTIPSALDVPTGLGKTSVMALWLIARARGAALPRRLVYVVDRLTVVDQATDEAEKLRKALEGEAKHFQDFDAAERAQAERTAAELRERLGLHRRKLPISTLRGAHVDNREWLDDPAAPAIVVGTVDMIGSRLLFQGYGVSAKMRPYQAGLLGVDTLVVLDEAHLVPPFAHLLRDIERDRDKSLWPEAEADRTLLPRFEVLPLSATQREMPKELPPVTSEHATRLPFRLHEEDARSDDIVRERLSASKRLTLQELSSRKLETALADEAWKLADEGRRPARCIVFCDSREVAEKVSLAIERKAAQRRGESFADVELFVGARRVHERDNAKCWLKEHGFIEAKVELRKPAFLVATAAGEVGIDIDADHMVCDLVAWERMVQRLGRVNRRGKGDAEVVVLWSEPSAKNADAPTEAEKRALTGFAAKAVIERLPLTAGAYNASPGALRQLADDARNDADLDARIAKATSDEPLRPALSRALVDAWSMTSLKEHTGRPEVAPWLRGWVEQEPQTTVIWRAHLPLRVGEKGRILPGAAEIEAFFEAAPPHESEKLETETYRVVRWLKERATALLKTKPQAAPAVDDDDEEADSETAETADTDASEPAAEPAPPAAMRLGRTEIAALLLSPGGAYAGHCTVGELAQEAKGKDRKDLEKELVGKTLIVDARLSGLQDGLLNQGSGDPFETVDASSGWSKQAGLRVRQVQSLSEDEEDEWPREHAFALRRDGEGEPAEWLVVEQFRSDAQDENGRAISSRPQELGDHQELAMRKMDLIAKGFPDLPQEAVRALALGALLHDEGKRADRWQRAFKAARDARKYGKTLPLAKTRGPIDQAILGGYRHELGSLLLLEGIGEPHAASIEALRTFRVLPEEWRDLVLHLVAAHHGGARPVIETRGCEAGPPSELEERARAVALRFARLQRRWGPWGLAWWEALLRAADLQASRANDAATEV